jgi:Domain of unknown function (DUF4386)
MTATQISPRRVGRILALASLGVILGGVFAQGFIANRLIDFSNAATTANNILAHRGLFQLSFTIFLIEMACNAVTTALWYVLLRPVNRSMALVAAFIDLSGVVMKTFARVFYIAPLWVLLRSGGDASAVLSGFTPEQAQSIALILLRVNNTGAATAVAFFGISILLNGYLIFRSTFLPRWLGALMMFSALGWLTYFYPPLGSRMFMFAALVSLSNAALMIFWLLVKGVNEERWKQQAARTSDI